MFDAIASLLLPLPAALFGRRRGGDRHGELSGGGQGADQPFGADDLDAFAAFADLAETPVGDGAGEGPPPVPEPPTAAPRDGAASGPDAPPQPRSEVAAIDLTDMNLAELDLAHQDIGELFPSPPERPQDPEFEAPPGWVVGETSLDGPHVPHDRGDDVADAQRLAELWHEVPPPAPFVDAPPFEDRVPDLDTTGGVWTPAAIEPIVGPRLDDPAPAPFSLNRLKRVSGPVEHPEAPAPQSFEPLVDPFTMTPTTPAARTNGDARAGAGHLTRSRVGRSGSTGAHGRGRRGRRPLPGARPPAAAPQPSVPHPSDAPPAQAAPTAEPRPLVVPVLVAADGVVATGTGSVRVARPEAASASSGPDGLVVHLLDHWCWAALDELGPDLVVRAGTTQLEISAGTTALLSIDDDGAQLVVVLEGEGHVSHRGGRIHLRSGAIAYLPLDGAPQVDVAPDDEIRADPLVARNLRLDAG